MIQSKLYIHYLHFFLEFSFSLSTHDRRTLKSPNNNKMGGAIPGGKFSREFIPWQISVVTK